MARSALLTSVFVFLASTALAQSGRVSGGAGSILRSGRAIGDDTSLVFGSDSDISCGWDSSAAELQCTVDDASSQTATTILALEHTTSLTAEVGMGAQLVFRSEDDAGNSDIVAAILSSNTSVSSTVEDADLVFQTIDASTLTETMRIVGASQRVGIGTAAPGAILEVSSHVYFADGNAGAPSLAFTNDPGTGFYSTGSGATRWASNGSLIWNFLSTSLEGAFNGAKLQYNGASSTVPTLQPYGNDGDTGIGADGSDDLFLIAGGVAGLRIHEESSVARPVLPSHATPNATVTPVYAGEVMYDSTSNVVCVSTAAVASSWVRMDDNSSVCPD